MKSAYDCINRRNKKKLSIRPSLQVCRVLFPIPIDVKESQILLNTMGNHFKLKQLIPFLDETMETFYDEMLSHHQISVFFENKDHIHRLIEKQKKNFIDSLSDTPEQMKNHFLDLDSLHYKLRVTSAGFLKDTEL